MNIEIVDTNVVLVANNQHQDISQECVAVCAQRLQAIMRAGKLALDNRFQILLEYQNKTEPRTGNRPGDAFVKWALQNNANPTRVDLTEIRDHPARGFESFPDDAALGDFDPADRKFVAVANAHAQKPPILQAADSKWLKWAVPLKTHSIVVEFLCEQDLARFAERKR